MSQTATAETVTGPAGIARRGDTAIDPRALRQVFGSFATGVTIVTVRDASGRPRGMTANSFTSVSLTPPLILVCVATNAPIWPAFAAAETFAVNVLAHSQQELSQGFAQPLPDKFAGVDWRPGRQGSPVLNDAVAHLECRRVREIEAGDHMILLGEVVDFAERPALPLIFHRGSYAALAL